MIDLLNKLGIMNEMKANSQGNVEVVPKQALKGPGDGTSDSIQAILGGDTPISLSAGEYIIPADVVSAIGNGDTDSGASILADLIENVRKSSMSQTEERMANPPKNSGAETQAGEGFFLGGLTGSKKKQVRMDMDPPWLQAVKKNNVLRAEAASQNEYVPYSTEDAFADFTPDELLSQEMIRGSLGAQDAYFDTAGTALQDIVSRASQPASQSELESYMNPYVRGAIESAVTDLNSDFDMKQQANRANAASQGAFGGSRQGVLEGRTEEGRMRAIADTRATGMMDAFNAAQNARNQDFGTVASNAMNLGNLAGAEQGNFLSQIQALAGSGESQRGLEQAQRDFEYNQFLEGRDWDLDRASKLASIISGTGAAQNSQIITKEGGGSLLGKLGGIGMMGAGVFSGNPMLAMQGLSSFSGAATGGLMEKPMGYASGGLLDTLLNSIISNPRGRDMDAVSLVQDTQEEEIKLPPTIQGITPSMDNGSNFQPLPPALTGGATLSPPDFGAMDKAGTTTQPKDEVAKVVDKVTKENGGNDIVGSILSRLNPDNWDMAKVRMGAAMASNKGDFFEALDAGTKTYQDIKLQEQEALQNKEFRKAQREQMKAQTEKWKNAPKAAQEEAIQTMVNKAASMANETVRSRSSIPGQQPVTAEEQRAIFNEHLKTLSAGLPPEVKASLEKRLGDAYTISDEDKNRLGGSRLVLGKGAPK